ncbi:type I restriction enzyme S subunit [Salinibacter ruber]|nr:restriction endonuclease subunit S [Salinibacter ruber]MCS3713769.1 type I restriction enzyme S subunit [Salinibacter ruber]
MEIVEDDELDELGADGASSSEEGAASETDRDEEPTAENAGFEEADPDPVTTRSGSRREDGERRRATNSSSKADSGQEIFGLGSVPEGWEVRPLPNVVEVEMGSSPPSSTYNEEEQGLPFYQGNADFGHMTPKVSTWCSDPVKTAEKDDVLISIRAPVGDLNIADEHCCIGRGLAALRPNEVNGLYLFYGLAERSRWLTRLASGSTFKSVSSADLDKVDLPVPPLPEQRKIASVLYAVDQAIQKTEAIIEQAKRVKRGLVGDVMTKGIGRDEFKSVHLGPTAFEIPAPWKCPQLEEITHKITDGAHITPDYVEEGVPFLSTKNIDPFEEHFDFSGYERYVTEKDHRKLNEKCNPEMGDVLICRRATIGPAQLVRTDDPFSIFVGLGMIKPRKSVMGEYLEQFFNWEPIIKMLNVKSPGSTMKTLNLSTLRKQRIPLPPLSEQEEIVGILSSVDEEVSNAKQEKKRLGRLKKGLMQDLLTGEFRTAGKAIDLLDEVVSHG